MVESSLEVWWLRAHWQFGGCKLIGGLVVKSSLVFGGYELIGGLVVESLSAFLWLRAHQQFGG